MTWEDAKPLHLPQEAPSLLLDAATARGLGRLASTAVGPPPSGTAFPLGPARRPLQCHPSFGWVWDRNSDLGGGGELLGSSRSRRPLGSSGAHAREGFVAASRNSPHPSPDEMMLPRRGFVKG